MIQFGNDKIKEIYVGSDKIKEVYHGADLVYQSIKDPRSWWVSTEGVLNYFESDNTPFANFYNSGHRYYTIIINGVNVVKNNIKEVRFGDGYSGVDSILDNFLLNCASLTSVDLSPLINVTSIGNYFLSSCTSLTSVDLSPLINVTSIGDYFLGSCTSLTSVDLSPLINVTSLGNYFLRNCAWLTSVDLSPLINVTSLGSGFLDYCNRLKLIIINGVNYTGIEVGNSGFTNVGNVSSNVIRANTEELGNIFRNKFSNLSNWSIEVP